MATIKCETHSRIVRIDLDTAEYIIGKVIRAVDETFNATTGHYLTVNDTFAIFGNKLVNILNEIRKGNK